MRTFELEADQLQSIDDVKHFLQEKEVKEGDTLKLITEQTKMIYIVVVLAMVFAAIMSVVSRNKKTDENKKKRQEEGDKILSDIFKGKGKTPQDIEKKIEKESGIKVRVERKQMDEEKKFWLKAVSKGIAKAYDTEPDYSDVPLMEPNPGYKPWKKAQ